MINTSRTDEARSMTNALFNQPRANPPSSHAYSDNGGTWAEAPITDPWHPAILTCDGGGIRGYSTLLMLQQLVHEIILWERRLEVEQNPGSVREFDENSLLLCHYFDYMYGTSTGGLIATLLGRLRMTVSQALKIYRDVGDTLFGLKNRRGFFPMTQYRHKPLERAVQKIIRENCLQHTGKLENSPQKTSSNGRPIGSPEAPIDETHEDYVPVACTGDDWHAWDRAIPYNPVHADFNWNVCQSVCLTATPRSGLTQAHLLRTFNHSYPSGEDDLPDWVTRYNNGADELKIWQVTRATSAAPFYFAPLEMFARGVYHVYKDGGIRENNPVDAAYNDFISRYGAGTDADRNSPALLLSLGTGRPDETKDGFPGEWPWPFSWSKILRAGADKAAVFKNVLIKYTEGEEKHLKMVREAGGEHRWYKRLNVSSGLEHLPLNAWKAGPWTDPATGETHKRVPGGATLSAMEEVTTRYLTRGRVSRKIDGYAAPCDKLKHVAEKLVRMRRAREETRSINPMRWDTYMGRYMTGQDIAPVGR